ncbi:MAG: type II secretion system F family protein [Roseiflexus sp.]|nr:type II secretion system F family protein [Roseiflexus sp.]MCS7288982.1 type II secretion system F family protein [Roseiflexus sp.]MDW8147098.1 type II secretion system F family protein [Roseiflexaceae bacterium]MDW8231712.1 type II secretion system F family protein [Roseiflexaceae bacterium]
MTGTLPLIGFGALMVLGLALIMIGVRRSSQPDVISDRLSQFTERTMTLEEIELQQPFTQRVLVPLITSILAKLGQYGPKQSAERLRISLAQAGNPGNLTPLQFSGIRLALAVILFIVVGAVTFLQGMETAQALMYTAIGAAMGYLLPGIWLGQQIKKRKKAIVKALPDALDLLCICVEAGLSFDQAMQRLTEKWDDPLSKEFKRVLNDTRLGRPRREAMKDMIDRCGVDDVQTFIGAVIQAEQLGVSIGRILRIQSDQMRIRRRQRAEEEAHKAPIKMLFPMVFLIFPALFIVILGPAVPRIIRSLGGLGG